MQATIMYGAGDVRVETFPEHGDPIPLAKETFFDNITIGGVPAGEARRS